MIWVKGSLGGRFTSPPSLPRLHKENSLLLIPTCQPPNIAKKLFSTRLQKFNADFSFCSSPFRVLEIKPFVFNETFPCPREQYHLAICLLALILTQYKKWNVTPFFNLLILTKYESEMLLYSIFLMLTKCKSKILLDFRFFLILTRSKREILPYFKFHLTVQYKSLIYHILSIILHFMGYDWYQVFHRHTLYTRIISPGIMCFPFISRSKQTLSAGCHIRWQKQMPLNCPMSNAYSIFLHIWSLDAFWLLS